MPLPGIIDLPSPYPAPETADRVESVLKSKGIKVFARIDQAAEAQAVGLVMPPMILLIFGDPKAGTPLMNRHPSIAIDLPLKALIRDTGDGKVLISLNSPEYLKERHSLEAEPFVALITLLKTATQ